MQLVQHLFFFLNSLKYFKVQKPPNFTEKLDGFNKLRDNEWLHWAEVYACKILVTMILVQEYRIKGLLDWAIILIFVIKRKENQIYINQYTLRSHRSEVESNNVFIVQLCCNYAHSFLCSAM